MTRRRRPTFSRLQKRLLEELGINAGRFKRTYAGYWQRRAGAFVWEAVTDTGKSIGSIYTATELLKEKHLVYAPEEGEILPCD